MSFIPKNYADSRRRFRHLAQSLQAEVDCYPIESLDAAGEPLTVDVAYLGAPSSESVLVITSGVHGVEGYAGAACMLYFMTNYLRHFQRQGVGVLLVHALNPWGFANDSRVTEHNVDLNRNFINFADGLPSSLQYAKVHPILCERYRPGLPGLGNELRLLFSAIGQKRRRSLQDGITSGQYRYSDGLFYGGAEPTQNRCIVDHLASRLGHAKHVRLLDIHTGLGKKGNGSLVTHLPDDTRKFRLLNRWLDNQVASLRSGAAVSSAVEGMLPEYVENCLGEGCMSLTLEFGVSSALFTLNALRLDNWLRTAPERGRAERLFRRAKKNMRNAFFSHTPNWELAILDRFEWTVSRLVASLAHSMPCDSGCASERQVAIDRIGIALVGPPSTEVHGR